MIWKSHKAPWWAGVVIERRREHRGTYIVAPLGVNLIARACVRAWETARDAWGWVKHGRAMETRTAIALIALAAFVAWVAYGHLR